jgi:DNA-binding PadR family transcriptional regulator
MAKTEFPSLSEKEFLIMGLLVSNASKRMYGLELVEKSNGALKRGTIYVTLSRLEDKGYVSSEREEEKPGIATPRRLYKTTGEGARIYRALSNAGGSAWLKEALA